MYVFIDKILHEFVLIHKCASTNFTSCHGNKKAHANTHMYNNSIIELDLHQASGNILLDVKQEASRIHILISIFNQLHVQ